MLRTWKLIRLAVAPLLTLAVAVGATACSNDSSPTSGWAIVKVEVLDGPPLTAICIDSICEEFDQAADVRRGEFSAFVDVGTRFQVLREGDPDGEGASAGSPVGGCTLVRLAAGSTDFVGGCDVEPADS